MPSMFTDAVQRTFARGLPRKPSYSSASPSSMLAEIAGLELLRSLVEPKPLLIALVAEAIDLCRRFSSRRGCLGLFHETT